MSYVYIQSGLIFVNWKTIIVLANIWQNVSVPLEGDITMDELHTMSKREHTRLEDIGRLKHKRLANEDAARMLGLILDHLIDFL